MSSRQLSGRHTRRATEKRALVFAALGDATRLHLVARLSSKGPQSIARLTEGRAVTRQAVSKHLRLLQAAGLARSSKLGRERVWELQPAPLETARQYLAGISAQWDAALSRLRAFVEDHPPVREPGPGRAR